MDSFVLLFRRFRFLGQATGLAALYILWLIACQILMLTILTYFLRDSARLNEISDVYVSSKIPIAALAAAGFVIAGLMFSPTRASSWQEELELKNFFERFLPGLFRGLALATGIVAAFILSGYYRYLGFVAQVDEALMTLLSVLLRLVAIMVMAYFEELIFRKKLLQLLNRQMPSTYALLLTAGFYCLVKAVQFDLGLMHMGTLVLVAVFLGLLARQENSFTKGAGFWAGLLILFHPIFGLPILGSDFPSFLLIQYQGPAGSSAGIISHLGGNVDSRTALFLTGGIGGPLSSFALQAALAIQILWLVGQKKAKLTHHA